LTVQRLAKVFGTTPEFWMNMQSRHDIQIAAKEPAKELAGNRVLEVAEG
jgi:plasmid maintenance system antidote protein VapI